MLEMGRLESVQDVCYQTENHFYSNVQSNVREIYKLSKQRAQSPTWECISGMFIWSHLAGTKWEVGLFWCTEISLMIQQNMHH